MRTEDDRNDRMTQGGSTGSSQADLSQTREQDVPRGAEETEPRAGGPEATHEQADREASASSNKTSHAETAPEPTSQEDPAEPSASSSAPQADDTQTAEVSAQGEARVAARDEEDDRDQNDLVIRYDLQMNSRVEGDPKVEDAPTQVASLTAVAEAAPVLALSDDGWAYAMRSRLDELSGRMDGMMAGDRGDDDDTSGLSGVLDEFRDQASDFFGRSQSEEGGSRLDNFESRLDGWVEGREDGEDHGGLVGLREQASDIFDRPENDDGLRLDAFQDRLDDWLDDSDDTDASDDGLSLASFLADDLSFSSDRSDAAGPASRLFGPEADDDRPVLADLAGPSFLADAPDGLNLPADWPVNDLGGGFTGWDGFDLGG